MTLQTASHLAYAYRVAEDSTVINLYFDLLEKTLQQSKLLNRPECIYNMYMYNCDESGFPLEHKPGKLITVRGHKQFSCVSSSDKAQFTVLAYGNAAGHFLPLMVIFDRKCLRPEHTKGEIPGRTFYGLSDSGWIDGELFEDWFQWHFLCHVPLQQPLLLLLDGHSSHYQP